MHIISFSKTTSQETILAFPAIDAHVDDLLEIHGDRAYCMKPSDSGPPIIVDPGASYAITPLQSDLHNFTPSPSKIKQLTGLTNIERFGQATWNIINFFGDHHMLVPIARLIPSTEVRLFSPQVYFKYRQGGFLRMDKDGIEIDLPRGSTLSILFHKRNNLPFIRCCRSRISEGRDPETGEQLLLPYDDKDSPFSFDTLSEPTVLITVADETNQNITPSQKELLIWHWRLPHAGMHWVQQLFHKRTFISVEGDAHEDPVIRTTNTGARKCLCPHCAACEARKACRESMNKSSIVTQMKLKQNILYPGEVIFVDQYKCSMKGCLLYTKGMESLDDRFVGGTIFSDASSLFIFTVPQVSLQTHDTLQAKMELERFVQSVGVEIKCYHGDNGIFKSKAWIDDCKLKDQKYEYSGVGAKHQNGVAERAMGTNCRWARSMLLHSALHWLEQRDSSL